MPHRRCPLLLAAFLSFGLSLAPGVPAQAPPTAPEPAAFTFKRPFHTVYALCIGVNSYAKAGFSDLECAVNDATQLNQLFRSRFGYETIVLTDREATRDGILAAVESLNARMRSDAARGQPPAFIFFFAGHGHTVTVDADQFGYIVPYTETTLLGPRAAPNPPSAPASELSGAGLPPGLAKKVEADRSADQPPPNPGGDDRGPGGSPIEPSPFDIIRRLAQQEKDLFDREALSMETLRRIIADCGAKHAVLFLDSCYSGYATLNARSSRHTTHHDPLVRDVLYWQDLQKGSRFIISGGGKDEQTFENRAAGNGVFTRELLRVLGQTRAISTDDLYFVLRDDVAQAAARLGYAMNPRFTPLGADDGRFVFIPRDDNVWMGHAARLYVQDDRVKAEARRTSAAQRRSAIDEAVDSKADFILITKATTEAAKTDLSRDPEWTERFQTNLGKARTGDGVAMANVSYMYRYGLGTPKDARQAQTWALEARQSRAEEGALAAAAAMAADTSPGRDPRVAEALAQQAAAQKQFIAGATLTFAGAAQGSPEAALLGVIAAAAAAARANEDSLFHSLAAMYQAYDAIPASLEAMRTSRDSAPTMKLRAQFRSRVIEIKNHAEQVRRDHDEETEKHDLASAAVRACNALLDEFDKIKTQLERNVRGIDSAHKAWSDSGYFLLRLEALIPYFAPPAPKGQGAPKDQPGKIANPLEDLIRRR